MVFGAHNSWYFFVTPFGPSFMKKTFSIVKTKLSFRNLWDTKKVTTKKVILQNMITHQFNYYIIIHCQIGHVILVMFDYFTNKGNDLTLLMLQTQHEVSENSNIQQI